MKPTLEYLKTRISVDTVAGLVYWTDATKHHRNLIGKEAGSPRKNSHTEKSYWHVKVDTVALKRSQIVYLFATGKWPVLQIDHINGNSLDDRIENLREVTATQNAWNHKRRAKKSPYPMGVKRLPSGRFIARIGCNKTTHTFGPFSTASEASTTYQQKRKEFFNEYA